jgi:hypothetical protein
MKNLGVSLDLLNTKIKRAINAHQKIEDLFLVIPFSHKNGEFETFIDTEFGKLRVFYCKDMMEFYKYGRETATVLLLSKKRFNYPTINKVSVRPFKTIGEHESHISKSGEDN